MSLKDDLRKLLLDPKRGNGGLSDEPARDGFGPARGDADYESGEEGGFQPPFIEQAETRTFHPERTLTDASGIFVIVYEPIATATFKDGNSTVLPVAYVNE